MNGFTGELPAELQDELGGRGGGAGEAARGWAGETMGGGAQSPWCREALVVHGSLPTGGVRVGFRPEELRLFSLSLQFPEVPLARAAAACAACGLVWTEL